MSDRYDFNIEGAARLVISLPSGDVEVFENEGGIHVSLSGKTDGVTVEQSGNTVSITSEKKASSFFVASSVRAAIGVPPGCDLEVTGASLDLVSRQRLGVVRARTASGDIRITEATELTAKTASGEIRFDVVLGDCDVAAASGDLVGDLVGGDLRASLASGDVRIGRVDGDISVKSASGDAHFDCANGDDIGIRSMSGDITVGLPTGIKLDFDLDALSGDVFLPPPAAPLPPPPQHPDHESSGAGWVDEPERKRSVRLHAKTVSGDIHVERAV
jgi:hypothetical protein